MATGIVSVAARLRHLLALSDTLLAVAAAAWVALAVLVSVHTARHRPRRPRLQSFALVASTAVLGARFLVAGDGTVARALWILALACWLGLLARRPKIAEPRGGSLLVVVATEGLAVLAALLAPRWAAGLLIVAFVIWALGLLLYPLVAIAVARALRDRPGFSPDVWILMGALAIGTLAGTELLVAARALHMLGTLRPWLRDVDLATWVVASAWILPLLAAELRSQARWSYRASRWAFVFPLGMYAVASETLGRAIGLAPLLELARIFFLIAVIAWAVVLLGLVRYAVAAREPTSAQTRP
jgi:tellurite resistance protein TehA-like permease